MKILFTQETDWFTNNPAQQHHIAEILSTNGHEIRVVDYNLFSKNNGKGKIFSKRELLEHLPKIRKNSSITIIRPSTTRLLKTNYLSFFLFYRREIHRQIKEFKPDVIVGWGIISSFFAINAAKKYKIPFTYYWLGPPGLLIPRKSFQPLCKRVERYVLKRADLILTFNDEMKDYVKSLWTSLAQVKIIRPGVDLDRFDSKINGITTRRQYGLDIGDRILFFMGSIYHFSGLPEVMRELSKNSNSQLKLLIVGEGEAYSDLEVFRNRYKLGDRVILTGEKDDSEIPALIATADICILPFDSIEPIIQDIIPTAIYEYMAMRKPVIATRLPGVRREFCEGNGVMYVDKPKEIIKIAEDSFKSGGGFLFRLGLNARKYVEKNSLVRVASEFEATLKDITRDKSHNS